MDMSFLDAPFAAVGPGNDETDEFALDQLDGARPAMLGPQVAFTPNLAGVQEHLKIVHGTTTLAFKYKSGVIVAVDSRASAGAYIASQNVKKVIEINQFLLGTMAGGAADCQYWQRYLGMRCRPDESGPDLYYLDSEGARIEGNLFSVGSGSLFAYGILDSNYKYDLEFDEAVELGRRAIYHATHNDAYSGGTVRVYHIDGNGWRRISEEDSTELHYKYNPITK
ncbi:nucleophile aminohydrolase [Pavlovales sp. CCMP2436]|nr:nucleophile aminohydrolase [Pavlovales sp. CCMP2436]